MSFLSKSLQSTTAHGFEVLYKIRIFLAGLVAVGLGLGFGYLSHASEDTAWLLLSLVTIIVMMLLVARRPLNGLIFLVALYPFLELWIEIPMGAGLPDLSFSRFMVAFLAIFMFARVTIGRFQFVYPLIGRVEVTIIGTIIGIGVASALSPRVVTGLEVLLSSFIVPLSTFVFARQLIRNKENLHLFLWAITLLGFVSALYAVYEVTTGHILFYGGQTAVEELKTSYGGSLRLLQGLLGTSPTFGRVFGFTIPVAFYLFFEEKSTFHKTWLVLIIAVLFAGLFVTYNRTAWYSAMISLTLLQFFYARFRPVYLVMVLVAAITLWATWEQLNQSEVVEVRVNHKSESFNGRDVMWTAAWNMWKAKPVAGWGYGGVIRQESGRFRTDGGTANFSSPQSEYLNVMVATGLLGAVPYFSFLILPLLLSLPLFFLARLPGWPGFIKPETVAIYWAVMICFLLGGYTVEVTRTIVRIIPFAVAGAIVGTHQQWLSGQSIKGLFSAAGRQSIFKGSRP